MEKFTAIEREAVLRILSSAIDCFKYSNFDEIAEAYTDEGNFVCNLPTKDHVKSLESAYIKLYRL